MASDQPNDPWRGQHPVPPAAGAAPADTTGTQPVGPSRLGAWWARLDAPPRALLIVGAIALPLVLCCGVAAIGAVLDAPDEAEPSPVATATATPTADAGTLAGEPSPEPTEEIPFQERTVDDSSLDKGDRRVRTEGAAGERTFTYEVTIVNGEETGRKLIKEEVTREPQEQVVAVGTKEADEGGGTECDPNYTGACVPIASDVDCEGGSGDGPAYVRGPVRVVGTDIYGLDRDGDGVACE